MQQLSVRGDMIAGITGCSRTDTERGKVLSCVQLRSADSRMDVSDV